MSDGSRGARFLKYDGHCGVHQQIMRRRCGVKLNGQLNLKFSCGQMSLRLSYGQMSLRLSCGQLNQRLSCGQLNQRLSCGMNLSDGDLMKASSGLMIHELLILLCISM